MTEVDWAVVAWDEWAHPFDDVDEIDVEGEFYAIFSARERAKRWDPVDLLYIGLAFRQPVVKRLKQEHPAYPLIEGYQRSNPSLDVVVTVGGLIKNAYSVERVSGKFAEEIEALLIHRNKPLFNTRSVESYHGRSLVVTNVGNFSPLNETSSCCSPHRADWRASGGYSVAQRLSRT